MTEPDDQFFDDPEKVRNLIYNNNSMKILSSIETKIEDPHEARRRSSIGYKSKLFASAEDLSRQIRRQSIQILLTPGRSLIRSYSQRKMKALPANAPSTSTKNVKFMDKENVEKNLPAEDTTSPRKVTVDSHIIDSDHLQISLMFLGLTSIAQETF